MDNAIIVNPSGGLVSANYTQKQQDARLKFNDKVFNDCQKNVSKAEVRDADWGLYAAQTCLAKDLVNATPDEARLITAKMGFIQNIINQNMAMDEDIFIKDEDQKIKRITAKADAKVKVIPARAAAIAGTLNAGSNAVDTLSNAAVKSTELINTIKKPMGGKIDLVA
jgi:hypothetical protein